MGIESFPEIKRHYSASCRYIILTGRSDRCQLVYQHDVYDRTRNLTQEILAKVRSLFDQSMHAFFEQEYQPRLSTEEADRARIYFPMLTSKSNLKPTGGRDDERFRNHLSQGFCVYRVLYNHTTSAMNGWDILLNFTMRDISN